MMLGLLWVMLLQPHGFDWSSAQWNGGEKHVVSRCSVNGKFPGCYVNNMGMFETVGPCLPIPKELQ